MIVKVFDDKTALATAAAEQAATALRQSILSRGRTRIIAATGASQFEFLDALTKQKNIDWENVEMFQLDEYIGLPITHPASFQKFLFERLINRTGITKYHLLAGDNNPNEIAHHVGVDLQAAPIDIAFVGIGENGHLAFNDPPADFDTEDPYLVVDLSEASRRQQVGESWFANLEEVPTQAISMSVRQILKAKEIIIVVPDERKAQAVKSCVEGEITPHVPASILRTHSNASLYLDRNSSALLSAESRSSPERIRKVTTA
jgi:glucosamine-6-phosphate deaminase